MIFFRSLAFQSFRGYFISAFLSAHATKLIVFSRLYYIQIRVFDLDHTLKSTAFLLRQLVGNYWQSQV